MTYPSIFDPATLRDNLERIDRLAPDTYPHWGRMNVAQMLAHLNVAYDLETGRVTSGNNLFQRILARTVGKWMVTGPRPYPKNMATAPVFLVSPDQDFERERKRLIANLRRVTAAGAAVYEGKPNPSFGKLTAAQWSVLFQKHLDHHLRQFGV